MYSVATRNAEQKHDVQLLRYNKNFSKKPIQQLEVIPDYQLLISLSDNVVTVHDMSVINFPALTTIQKTRGATLFTLDIKVWLYEYISLYSEVLYPCTYFFNQNEQKNNGMPRPISYFNFLPLAICMVYSLKG